MILNKIFKESHSNSIDDMVMNNFYKEINDKLNNIKNIMNENNDANDIKLIKEDLYDKLYAIYDIKRYQINPNTEIDIKKEIDTRAESYNIINNNKIVGGYLLEGDSEEIIEKINQDIKKIEKLIKVVASDNNKKYENDIIMIKNLANKINSGVKEIYKKKNLNSASILKKDFINNRTENINNLINKYKSFKDNILEKIKNDDDNDNKGKDSSFNTSNYTIKTINDLKNNNLQDEFSSLMNYVQGLKNISGGGNTFDKKVIINDNKYRLELYKKLKSIYIDLITNYFKIIDEAGNEEEETSFLYELDLENSNSTIINNTYIKFLKLNNDKLQKIMSNNDNLKELVIKKSSQYKDFNESIESEYKILISNLDGYIKSINQEDSEDVDTAVDINNTKKKTKIIEKDIYNKLKNLLTTLYDENEARKSYNKKEITEDKIKEIKKRLDNHNINEKFTDLKSKYNELKEIGKDKTDKTINIDIENESNILKKKTNISKRIKILNDAKPKLESSLEKLFTIVEELNKLNLSEYEMFVKQILSSHKLQLFSTKQESTNHTIIKSVTNEINELEEQKKKYEEQSKLIDKQKSREKNNIIQPQYRFFPPNDNSQPTNENIKGKKGGAANENENEYIYNVSLDDDKEMFKNKNSHIKDLLIRNDSKEDDRLKYNLGNLMVELKNNVKYTESFEEYGEKKKDFETSSTNLNINNDYNEQNIYETLWNDYNSGINNSSQNRAHTAMSNIRENENLYGKILVNNLDPQLVLKINFQDKAIFLLLVFIIRTISIILLEFLIDNNIIKTLQGSIIFYGFIYMLILFLLVFLVNYDSYKLRILLNYLNIHINSSNLILQNVLFIIFISLVFILVKSDDILKYFGSILDYTNIYNNIYDYSSYFDNESKNNLSHSEKLKLLYRIDIISMIIFIFTGFLVLVL